MKPISLPILAIGKPRMTRSDCWKKRPCVLRYWEYKDALKEALGCTELPDVCHLIFHLPMPKSWKLEKKQALVGTPHKGKPDTDNLVKGYWDAIYDEDSFVWDGRATKLWSVEPRIEIFELEPYSPPVIETVPIPEKKTRAKRLPKNDEQIQMCLD